MPAWLLVIIIIFSYLLIGAVITSAWEKIELKLLGFGYDIKPWLSIKYYPDPSWYTDWDFVGLCIIFWPFFLLILFCKGVYLLIRKIFGLQL